MTTYAGAKNVRFSFNPWNNLYVGVNWNRMLTREFCNTWMCLSPEMKMLHQNMFRKISIVNEKWLPGVCFCLHSNVKVTFLNLPRIICEEDGIVYVCGGNPNFIKSADEGVMKAIQEVLKHNISQEKKWLVRNRWQGRPRKNLNRSRTNWNNKRGSMWNILPDEDSAHSRASGTNRMISLRNP